MPSKGEARFATVKGRQQAYLLALMNGSSRRDALTAAGITSPNTVVNWRKRFPEFAEQERALTAARMRGGVQTTRVRPRSNDPVDMMDPEIFANWRREMFGFETYYHQRQIVRTLHTAMKRRDLGIVLVLVAPDTGKGVSLTTMLPLWDGSWKKASDIRLGDGLFGRDGMRTLVTGVFPQGVKACRRVEFSDGTHLDVDLDHNWFVRTHDDRKGRVLTTAEIAANVFGRDGRARYGIPVCEPLQMPEADLPIDPWLLGYWLGNGSVGTGQVHTHGDDGDWVAAEITRLGHEVSDLVTYGSARKLGVRGFMGSLRTLGVLHDKHVPERYLWASERQRRRLLAGLLDSDGYVDGRTAGVELSFTNKRLADDAAHLIRSLGLKLRRNESEAAYKVDGVRKVTGRRYRLFWTMHDQAFMSPRKTAMWTRPTPQGDRLRWRSIIGVYPIDDQETVCFSVDAPDQLYVAGEDMIVTHNTTTLVDWACRRLSVEDNLRMVVLQENQKRGRRFLGRVKSRMTTLHPYITDHGRPFYVAGQEKAGKVWSADAIKLWDFDADEADFSLEALGWTSQVSGQRIDCLIVDDIQSLKSLNQTEKMFDIFRQDFLSRITTEKGMIVVIGTRVGPGDFYERLMDEGLVSRENIVNLPAHNGVVTECDRGDECDHPELLHYEPLVPEMITPHQLMNKERHVGRSAWSRNWMQKPEDDGTMAFPPSLVDAAYDNDLDIGELREGGATILGLDPAISGNCVLTVGGYYPDRLDIIDQTIRSDLGSTEGIFQMIETGARRYKPRTLVIETNSWQKLFANDVRLREMARVYGFRIEPNDTTKIKNDEVLGVATMANSLGRREMFFTGTEAGRRRLELLDHELKSWRPYVKSDVIKQDTVMSTWFIHRYWLQNRMRVAVHSDFTSPTRLPWTPTGMSPVPQSSEAMQFARHQQQERERGLVRVE